MNKLVMAVALGYLIGNDKMRNELGEFIKTATNKTIDIAKKASEEANRSGEDSNEIDQLPAPAETLPQK